MILFSDFHPAGVMMVTMVIIVHSAHLGIMAKIVNQYVTTVEIAPCAITAMQHVSVLATVVNSVSIPVQEIHMVKTVDSNVQGNVHLELVITLMVHVTVRMANLASIVKTVSADSSHSLFCT